MSAVAKGDIANCPRHIWFAPKTGHPADALTQQPCAKKATYLITSGLAVV
jgi:hypothetical protein